MPVSDRFKTILFYIGLAVFVIGTVDPLEGSVLIIAGGILLTLSLWLREDPYRRWLLTGTILIALGVIYLFYISSLGGIGGNTGRSWVWGLPLIPYPAGWLMIVITLLIRRVKRDYAQKA